VKRENVSSALDWTIDSASDRDNTISGDKKLFFASEPGIIPPRPLGSEPDNKEASPIPEFFCSAGNTITVDTYVCGMIQLIPYPIKPEAHAIMTILLTCCLRKEIMVMLFCPESIMNIILIVVKVYK
jgi:hypothetical protein